MVERRILLDVVNAGVGYRVGESRSAKTKRTESQRFVVSASQLRIIGRLSRFAVDPIRFWSVSVSVASASLFHVGTSVERGRCSFLSNVRLCNRARRELDESTMAALGSARRNCPCRFGVAAIDKRAGPFEPV